MHVVGVIIELVLGIFIVLLFVRFVVDWVQIFARSWTPHGPGARGARGRLLGHRPADQGVRRFIPPLRLGGDRARPELR